MTEFIITSSVLILVVILLRHFLKGKISLRMQYALWALVLIRLLIPVSFFSSPISAMNAVQKTSTYTFAEKALEDTRIYSDFIRNTEMTPDESREVGRGTLHEIRGYAVGSGSEHLHSYIFMDSLSAVLVRVLKMIWFFGAGIVGAILLLSNLSFGRKLRRTRKAIEMDDSKLPVYLVEALPSPFLFGLFRPSICITQEVAGDETKLRHVLAHELTHYRHGDHIWSLMRGLSLTIHWYNPLVWLAAALSRRDSELACDEGTLKRIGDEGRMGYGRTLIGLTCEKRKAMDFLCCATTMTDGKKGIKERITLIAKKPKVLLPAVIALVLVAVFAIGCTFAGAKESVNPWTWAQELNKESIIEAIPWSVTDRTRLSNSETEELLSILIRLTKRNFTENKRLEGGTPEYGLRLNTDGGTYNLNQSIAAAGSLEMNYNGLQWWIDSQELSDFIISVIEKRSSENSGTNSNAIVITVEIDGNIPQAAIDNAVDYVSIQADNYKELGENPPSGAGGYTITDAKITGLTQINTGTAGLTTGYNMYLLEYRLRPDYPENVVLAGGMQLVEIDGEAWITEWGSTGQPYLLLKWDDSGAETVWQRICVTNTDVITVEYGTPEMLERYGDKFTAAAIELHMRFLDEQKTSAQSEALEAAIVAFMGDGWWYAGSRKASDYKTAAFEPLYEERAEGSLAFYGISLYRSYVYSDAGFSVVEDFLIPCIITLDEKTLSCTDFWVPGDGAYHDMDIYEKFPAEIADEAALNSYQYHERLAEKCDENSYDRLFMS